VVDEQLVVPYGLMQPVGGGRKPGGNVGSFPKKAAFKHLCQRAGGARSLLSLAKINMVSNNGAIYKKKMSLK